MATPRLETPRDLVQAVLRSREVEFPLRALHRVPREGPLEEVSIAWTESYYDAPWYWFARDLALVEASARGLCALGVHALAQSVALEGAPATELALAAPEGAPGACRLVRILPPEGPRPMLRAPRFARGPVDPHPTLGARLQDRPQFGLLGPAEGALRSQEFPRRDVFTVHGTRGALRATAFLLFRLATDRAFTGEVELEGPEGWGNLGIPSCHVTLARRG